MNEETKKEICDGIREIEARYNKLLSEKDADIEALKLDKERLDWLESHPETLKDCTWINVILGRLFSFIKGRLLGECEKTLRSAIDIAIQQEEKKV